MLPHNGLGVYKLIFIPSDSGRLPVKRTVTPFRWRSKSSIPHYPIWLAHSLRLFLGEYGFWPPQAWLKTSISGSRTPHCPLRMPTWPISTLVEVWHSHRKQEDIARQSPRAINQFTQAPLAFEEADSPRLELQCPFQVNHYQTSSFVIQFRKSR